MDTLELSYARLTYTAPVIEIAYERDIELGLFEVRDLIAHCEKLSGGKPYLVLADVTRGLNLTPQGRKVASNANEMPLHRGTAVLVNSKLFALAANFFQQVQRPPYPYRAFTDRVEAEKWLEQLSLETFGGEGLKSVG